MDDTDREGLANEFTLADVEPGARGEYYPLITDSALASILDSLGTAPNFRECMRQCALTLHQATQADGASVFRLVGQGPGQELEQLHSVGFPGALAQMTLHMGLTSSFSGAAAKQGRLILSRDPAADPRVPEAYRQLLSDAGFKTLAALPLLLHAQVVGAVALGWRARVNLSEHDCAMLMRIAYGIAIAVEHDLREVESTSDSLTGVFNRREFDARMPEVLQRYRDLQRPLTMAVLDLDDFKQCNDQHGHLLGDEILKAAARLMQARVLMQGGEVFRIGGEEFVLLLPERDASGGKTLVAEICSEFAKQRFVGRDGEGFGVTMSAGIAQYDPAANESVQGLFGRADHAMYRAKMGGKDRIEQADAAAPTDSEDG